MKILSTQYFPEALCSGGVTKELFIHPDGSRYNDRWFDYRLSVTWGDTPETSLSHIPGYNRYICLLEGCIHLNNPQDEDNLQKKITPGEVHHIQTQDSLVSHSDGKVQDFSLIYNPDAIQPAMYALILGEDETYQIQTFGTTYIYLHAGRMKIEDKVMKDQDMLILEPNKSLEIKALRPGQLVITTIIQPL